MGSNNKNSAPGQKTSVPDFLPVILQEQKPLENGIGLPEDAEFLRELKKFLQKTLGQTENTADSIFKYVGLLRYPTAEQNYMLYFLPKYYNLKSVKSADEIQNKKSRVYQHFRKVLKTIHKYRQEKIQTAIKENRLLSQADPDTDAPFKSTKDEIAVMLIDNYLENGVYTNMKTRRTLCGNGEIDWQHTINTVLPEIRDNTPYYFDYWTTDRVPNTETLIARVHEAIIKDCSLTLTQWGIAELLDLETPMPCEGDLSDFGDNEGIERIINQELSIQFVTQKQNLLKLMLSYIKSENISATEGVSMFGTGSFHAVWEKVCGSVFDNQLDKSIDSDLLPEDMKDKKIWSDIEARSIWKINGSPTKQNGENGDDKEGSKLRPDFVALRKKDEKNSLKKDALYILDAKYYVPKFSKNGVSGCPGVGDVNKQHLYQLTYHPLIQKNNWQVVNAFLMPETTENSEDMKVEVICSLFEDLKTQIFSFVPIQTLFLNPDQLFDDYLDGKCCLENKLLKKLDEKLEKECG